MGVNSIHGDVAALTLQPLKPSVPLDHPAKWTPSTNDHLSNSTETSSVSDANTNNMVSSEKKQNPEASIESKINPVRTMSHIVVVYNMQGNVRIKFMDSNSNVIYQIPTESVAKIEDQMMKLQTSTTING
jgi:hypothetical protein